MKENSLPIHTAHDGTRKTLEDSTSYVPVKVNLRSALEMSLKTRAYVEDFVDEFVQDYKKNNSMEQELIQEYVLVADLLKRGLWNELKQDLSDFVHSEEFFAEKFADNKGTMTSLSEIKGKPISWEDANDFTIKIVGQRAIRFFDEWAQRMENGNEQDEVYRQRYGELSQLSEMKQKKYGMPTLPKELMRLGFTTGMEYPIGMLKYIPELLKEKGSEVTLESVMEVYSKNLVSVSSTYASQDIITFQTIENIVNPTRREVGDFQPANFSTELFQLDENGKMVFKAGMFEKIKEQSKIKHEAADGYVRISKIVNEGEKRNSENKDTTKVPWKTCPVLFGNLTMDYENFFRPIAKKIAEIQGEYK